MRAMRRGPVKEWITSFLLWVDYYLDSVDLPAMQRILGFYTDQRRHL
jgi:hypothetical protein